MTAEGSYPLTVRVSNDRGYKDSEEFTWVITGGGGAGNEFLYSFANTASLGTSLFTHTREGSATAQDATGFLVRGSWHAPLFPGLSGSTCTGIQIERAATNLIETPESFDSGGWVDTGGAVVSAGETAPDGGADATKFDLSNGSKYTSYTLATTGAHDVSLFVKRDNAQIDGTVAVQDTAGSATGSLAIDTANVSDAQWERLTDVTPNLAEDIPFDGAAGVRITALAASPAKPIAWGAQLEIGGWGASSYIGSDVVQNPNTATLTRAFTRLYVDIADMPGPISGFDFVNNACGQITGRYSSRHDGKAHQHLLMISTSGANEWYIGLSADRKLQIWKKVAGVAGLVTWGTLPDWEVGDKFDIRWRLSSTLGLTLWYALNDGVMTSVSNNVEPQTTANFLASPYRTYISGGYGTTVSAVLDVYRLHDTDLGDPAIEAWP
jgi:hypothetical protein